MENGIKMTKMIEQGIQTLGIIVFKLIYLKKRNILLSSIQLLKVYLHLYDVNGHCEGKLKHH